MRLRPVFAFAFLSASTVALAHCSSGGILVIPDGGGGGGGDGGSNPTHPSGVPSSHLPSGPSCRTTRAPGNVSGTTCPDGGSPECCTADSQCTQGTNGRCTRERNGSPTCSYDTCTSNADCATGTTCLCTDVTSTEPNSCLTGNCRQDSDCGANEYCSPSYDSSCGSYGGYVGFYCHSQKDDCYNDTDCTQSSTQGVSQGPGQCVFSNEASKWTCIYVICAW